MEPGVLRGLFTLFMFLAFIGICLWAWSSRRKNDFEVAAGLPLEDDELINVGMNAEAKIPPESQQGAPNQSVISGAFS